MTAADIAAVVTPACMIPVLFGWLGAVFYADKHPENRSRAARALPPARRGSTGSILPGQAEPGHSQPGPGEPGHSEPGRGTPASRPGL